jgi:type I site-specific restriction endonuclease
MELLKLPTYLFRTKLKEGKKLIFDAWRRKWVSLTPEEWVRQNFARYLTEEKHFPSSRLGVEYSLNLNQQNFRADLVFFGRNGEPLMIIECKAPEVKISQQVFDQIVRYNMKLKVKYLIITNGVTHYCCIIDKENLTYSFLEDIPDFRELKN